jgi:hypothetical protein
MMAEDIEIEMVKIDPENPRSIFLIYIAMMIVTSIQGLSLPLLFYSEQKIRTIFIIIGNIMCGALHLVALYLINYMLGSVSNNQEGVMQDSCKGTHE